MKFSLRVSVPKLVLGSLNKTQLVVFSSQPAMLPVRLVLVQVTRTAKTVKKAGLKMKVELVWVSNAWQTSNRFCSNND